MIVATGTSLPSDIRVLIFLSAHINTTTGPQVLPAYSFGSKEQCAAYVSIYPIHAVCHLEDIQRFKWRLV